MRLPPLFVASRVNIIERYLVHPFLLLALRACHIVRFFLVAQYSVGLYLQHSDVSSPPGKGDRKGRGRHAVIAHEACQHCAHLPGHVDMECDL